MSMFFQMKFLLAFVFALLLETRYFIQRFFKHFFKFWLDLTYIGIHETNSHLYNVQIPHNKVIVQVRFNRDFG